MPEDIRVGERIKKLREERSLTVEQVAGQTGLSVAELIQIEDHMISPSLGTLITLAKILKTPMGYFFDEDAEKPFSLVRAHQRKSISRFASTEGLSYGYSYQSLGSAKNRKMEPFLVTLTPTQVEEVSPNRHAGEEFFFVLEGEVQIDLDGHRSVLSPGDSIYYDSNIPHLVSCHKGRRAKIIAVIWPEEEMIIF